LSHVYIVAHLFSGLSSENDRKLPIIRYNGISDACHAHKVTSEKLCHAQHDIHFQADTCLCLLHSIQKHLALLAGLLDIKLPQHSGEKGGEPLI
uniref:Protein FMC1 homolog n=1 Tax=Salvator merianae TaxID=96440 RepID=A0A8D0DVM8_SALMN